VAYAYLPLARQAKRGLRSASVRVTLSGFFLACSFLACVGIASAMAEGCLGSGNSGEDASLGGTDARSDTPEPNDAQGIGDVLGSDAGTGVVSCLLPAMPWLCTEPGSKSFCTWYDVGSVDDAGCGTAPVGTICELTGSGPLSCAPDEPWVCCTGSTGATCTCQGANGQTGLQMVEDNHCYQWRQGCSAPYDAGETADSGGDAGSDGAPRSADASDGG
jgi:hypothetical protein